MIGQSLSKTGLFNKPLLLQGIDRILPAGGYRGVTDEELTEELSFPLYRHDRDSAQ